ncbi:hypothetical protein EJ06DRAFT_340143 [Trichodelitschia bisporula]|uniref:Uncharacterized protein n=1 Tax=Trichodelitschia bisporula TaxID=703511 RepID=A0A6G1I2P3_9PEZI|nr:hypothetical protein EJ06DRAFT_340143 [Trichodelitschia bisporula]
MPSSTSNTLQPSPIPPTTSNYRSSAAPEAGNPPSRRAHSDPPNHPIRLQHLKEVLRTMYTRQRGAASPVRLIVRAAANVPRTATTVGTRSPYPSAIRARCAPRARMGKTPPPCALCAIARGYRW